jgi:tetratricopeptide (TPR) repeat protein
MQMEIADRFGLVDTLDSIARAHASFGRYDEATACYSQARELCREFEDPHDEAQILAHLGEVSLAAGDPKSAVAAWQDALAISDDLDLPEAAGLRAKLSNLTAADRRRGGR